MFIVISILFFKGSPKVTITRIEAPVLLCVESTEKSFSRSTTCRVRVCVLACLFCVPVVWFWEFCQFQTKLENLLEMDF